VIVPRKPVIELGRLLLDVDDPVQLYVGSSQIGFAFGDVRMTSKVVDGEFPNYPALIRPVSQHFCIDRLKLQQALQRAAILTNQFRGVRWTLGTGCLRIGATNGNQEEAEEVLGVDYSGEPTETAFNADYVEDAIESLRSEQVVCEVSATGHQMQITMPDRSDFRYLISSMRI